MSAYISTLTTKMLLALYNGDLTTATRIAQTITAIERNIRIYRECNSHA